MGAFSFGHRLRRAQPGFAAPHAVHVAKVDPLPHYWVTNPLFAEDHDGEWWTEDELRRAVQALPYGKHLVAKTLLQSPTAPPRPAIEIVRISPYTSFWDYDIRGTATDGYTITREQRTSARGFSALLGRSRIGTVERPFEWSGKVRSFAKIVDPASAYDGVWLDLLAGGITTRPLEP
jgi:hypothetical protein